jgi:carbamate kinase
MTRIAVALGGNAMIRRGEPGSIEVQRHNLEVAARSLVDLAERSGAEIVLTHGNGPQVGFLAIQADMASAVVPPPPLDVLGAESQGQIGYLLVQALRDAFIARGIRREIAVILTQTVVRADDPAFAAPTKPVGPVYTESVARSHAAAQGWTIAPDGKHWRRVVASPAPLRIVEAQAIRSLVETGALVVAGGGGGVPVVELPDGRYEGREAVVDKDLAAVVLARAVGADGLLLLTDVAGVIRGWGTPEAEMIRRLSVEEAFEGLAADAWPAGSMGPKVRACADFVRGGGRFAAIGALDEAAAVIWGRAGTRFGTGRLGLPRAGAPVGAAAG